MTRDVGVVIVAAGESTRTGGKELKQFRWVAGKPMLLHSLQTFMSRSDVVSVVCVVPQNYVADPPPWIFQCDVDRLLLSVGGRTRTESVRNGLDDLPNEAGIALIHDAARPLIDHDVIDRVVERARAGVCAVPGLPVVDTIKEVDADGGVMRTLDRERLWRVQTPQGFPRAVIHRAHSEAAAAKVTATDDAALCERLGIPVVMVPGSERAMKITEQSDFARVEALFASA
ncbi:MAG TPA: 2-C-methyl-D-erythritol 4-phosphate cytidylyltransferase [Gemmatimonadaceae bacterium]|nr:2-C-methyl-D-erythritol 4-phosphate cytidylyltransferase [Gemmatimonadaceae bacterium]